MDYKRNIRVLDQRKRGAGGFVVFYTVHDIPERVGNMPGTHAGRVGMDLPTSHQAFAARNALRHIPDDEWNYRNAWTIGMAAV